MLFLTLCLQDKLPELYCGHDAFLFSSRYEAWGMPVLEAMAAGLAVVATRCLGLDTFARHAMNALLAGPQVSGPAHSQLAGIHHPPPRPPSHIPPLLPLNQHCLGIGWLNFKGPSNT